MNRLALRKLRTVTELVEITNVLSPRRKAEIAAQLKVLTRGEDVAIDDANKTISNITMDLLIDLHGSGFFGRQRRARRLNGIPDW